MKDFDISTSEAKQNKLFYIVANLIIINLKDKTFLVVQRGKDEKVLPGKWSFPGGKLEHEDVKKWILEQGFDGMPAIENVLSMLAAREAKEECGLDVSTDSKLVMNRVFIRPDGIPVFMACLATEYTGGEVKIEDGAIADHAWVRLDELDKYDTIPGLRDEAETAMSLF